MRPQLAALSLFCLLALTGAQCSFRSPQGVVEVAYHALQDNDRSLWRRTLEGQAKRQWGSRDGMMRLRAEIIGLQPTIGAVVLTREVKDMYDYWVVERHYDVAIEDASVSPPSGWRVAKVVCNISYHCLNDGPVFPGEPDQPGYGRNGRFYPPGHPALCMAPDTSTECRIREILP